MDPCGRVRARVQDEVGVGALRGRGDAEAAAVGCGDVREGRAYVLAGQVAVRVQDQAGGWYGPVSGTQNLAIGARHRASGFGVRVLDRGPGPAREGRGGGGGAAEKQNFNALCARHPPLPTPSPASPYRGCWWREGPLPTELNGSGCVPRHWDVEDSRHSLPPLSPQHLQIRVEDDVYSKEDEAKCDEELRPGQPSDSGNRVLGGGGCWKIGRGTEREPKPRAAHGMRVSGSRRIQVQGITSRISPRGWPRPPTQRAAP